MKTQTPPPPALNDDQGKGFDALMKFIESKEQDQMFCLKGYAGTGKTFLIARVVNTIIEKDSKLQRWQKRRIAMTAPTNKAVQVLRESSGLPAVTYKTIHSLLGLKEVIKDSGDIEFEKAYDEDPGSIRDYNILVIDEVSMLDDKLFFEVKRYNNQCKIIMMGDPAQIPPVNKVDCEPFLNPQMHGIIEFQLTKIMRQANGSKIVSNSFRIRENLGADWVEFDQGEDLKVRSSVSDRDAIRNYFTSTFTDASVADHTKVIAWTNQKVGDYNRYIRGLLFGNNIPKLMIGERLVMNEPRPCDFQMDEYDDKIKYSSKPQYELLKTNQEVTVMGFEILPVKLSECTLSCYVVRIEFISETGKKKEGRLKILHELSERSFSKQLEDIKRSAITGDSNNRKFMWKRYYTFKRSVADVEYAYAITAHKSQGSTYKATVLDMPSINRNPNVVERNRILYTALTRAKNLVTLIV